METYEWMPDKGKKDSFKLPGATNEGTAKTLKDSYPTQSSANSATKQTKDFISELYLDEVAPLLLGAGLAWGAAGASAIAKGIKGVTGISKRKKEKEEKEKEKRRKKRREEEISKARHEKHLERIRTGQEF